MSGKDSVLQVTLLLSCSLSCSAMTTQLVDEYEQKLKHFMNCATVSQFKQLFPATATSSKLQSSEKVSFTLKLKNYWDKCTLDDLTKLVTLFGVSGRHLHLRKAEDGCIAVTWLCSTSKVKQLEMAILEATGSLQTMGVLHAFIGGEELVLECSVPGIYFLVTMIHWVEPEQDPH